MGYKPGEAYGFISGWSRELGQMAGVLSASLSGTVVWEGKQLDEKACT